ncbi:MAG: glutamate--tRNA ligase [Patescibacteria group bacterium]
MNNPQKEIRARFAPSPTGHLHIGGARTALFNWLFSKQHKGKFILRIDDTDIERSQSEFEKNIIDGLKWLGLNWDEGPDIEGDYGPYRQSERGEIYKKYIQKLLDENKAYYCFCSKEELEADRQAMLSQGIAPRYSGKCRNLPKEKSEKLSAKGESVIRFKVPEHEVEFTDLIRGKIKFNSALIGDLIIAKNIKAAQFPLFNFAGIVDDCEMKISHVIRGEDHLPNTPKQILMAEALGFEPPKYAHLPLILAPDRSKLSKRYMETSLIDYEKQGYLAEAIINFLALLGWRSAKNPDKEIFSPEELIAEFEIKKIQKAGAIFNIEKLAWLNGQYIKQTDSMHLAEKLKNFIPQNWFENKNILIKAVHAEKERMKKLADFKEMADFFFELPDYDASLLNWRETTSEETSKNLNLLKEEIEKIPENKYNLENLETSIMPLAEKYGRGELLWPLRAALSGKEFSPGPFEIMEILEKEETLKRIEIALKKL